MDSELIEGRVDHRVYIRLSFQVQEQGTIDCSL